MIIKVLTCIFQTFDECVRGKHAECVSMQGDNAEEGYFKMIPFFCGQQDFCRSVSFLFLVAYYN